MPQALDQYEGAAKPVAVLTEIYRWNGRDYEKASTRYPAYYRNVVLPGLERELRLLDAVSEIALTPSERHEHHLERQKVMTEIAAVRAGVQ